MNITNRLLVVSVVLLLGSSCLASFAGCLSEKKVTDVPPPAYKPRGDGGYSASNFAVGSSMAPDGRLSSDMLYNPPYLGKHFAHLGTARLVFAYNGRVIRDNDCEKVGFDSCWPFGNNTYSDKRLGALNVSVTSFAPVVALDANETALPSILYDVTVKNGGSEKAELDLYYICQFNAAYGGFTVSDYGELGLLSNGLIGMASSNVLAFGGYDDSAGTMSSVFHDINKGILSGSGSGNTFAIKSGVSIGAGSNSSLKLAFFVYENASAAAARFNSIGELASYVSSNWEALHQKTLTFLNLIPRTGDTELDSYTRWYMTASIMNTKLLKDGTVVVMSYVELNGRDTFWACYLHLVFWPELEKRMIKETADKQYVADQDYQGQRVGQIPTTVLPEIWRMWDVDIAEYFVLRVWRYANWTGDTDFLKTVYPNVILAMNYILSWDEDTDFVPECPNFWADWKDIGFMDGRTDAPDIALLWLATLDAAANIAEKSGDGVSATVYRSIRSIAEKNINKNIDQGGLWNGRFYQNLWETWTDNRVYEDQVFGIVFGVVSNDKVEKIYDALSPNETPWGVREQYPYRNDSKTLEMCGPGVYHNGGIWVYLNFADAFSRLVSGYPEDAIRIIKKVAVHDLKKNNDFKPHEWLHGETGENCGNFLQAWDSVLFGAIYFGYMGVSRTPDGGFSISPYVRLDTGLSTSILLPNAVIRIEQKPLLNQGALPTAKIDVSYLDCMDYNFDSSVCAKSAIDYTPRFFDGGIE